MSEAGICVDQETEPSTVVEFREREEGEKRAYFLFGTCLGREIDNVLQRAQPTFVANAKFMSFDMTVTFVKSK